ncbi:hypothetical protein C7S16_3775 [Burkholderia thailandensis]|uniref:Uncharacterized protein n=1 Tax=Burkholderia thailandensis TaxID=57975 RepID=A0AAW9CT19_BURTH|nr:hypothetical protein [Burkholderia thailandensis]MDW9254033.1 hypothetical protein [Burkholderia thailandensis]
MLAPAKASQVSTDMMVSVRDHAGRKPLVIHGGGWLVKRFFFND